MIDVDSIEVGLLDMLPVSDRDALIAVGRARRYPPRSVLFLEGDDAHAVHLLRDGVVKLSSNVAGRDVVLDVVGAGDVVGELSVIDGRTRSASAIVLVTADVVVVRSDDFHRFLAGSAAASAAMMRHFAGRLRRASQRQVEYGALDGTGRVCGRLVEMMDRYGAADEGVIVIDTPLSQSDIAAWAGLSREAVVKALHVLRRLGWVRTTGATIDIIDAMAIRMRADPLA